MILTTTEQHVIDTVAADFKNDQSAMPLKTVESHPGKWDASVIKHMASRAPGIFVGWSMGRVQDNYSAVALTQWHLFVVTKAANGYAHKGGDARRRGTDRAIGAYQIVERLIPLLHNHKVPNVSTLEFQSVASLFTAAIEMRGIAVYDLRFNLTIDFGSGVSAASLNDFILYSANHDLAPDDPDAQDQVILPTA